MEYTKDKSPQQKLKKKSKHSKTCDLGTKDMFYQLVTYYCKTSIRHNIGFQKLLPIHCFFDCPSDREAGMAFISLLQPFDQSLTIEKALECEISCDALYKTPAILILATGLEVI